MNVGDYHYYYSYYIELNKYYEENVSKLNISQRCSMCDELKKTSNILNLK